MHYEKVFGNLKNKLRKLQIVKTLYHEYVKT